MPQITVEYTNNLVQLASSEVLLNINQAVLASGQFEETDIKSRLLALNDFLVGTQKNNRAFVHVKVAILSGRSIEIKKQLSESVFQALKASCTWPNDIDVQWCVEILDIERESYTKVKLLAE